MALEINAYLVDGSVQPLGTDETDAAFLSRMRTLEDEGFCGRELIEKLFTDDWGAPPKFVVIIGDGIERTLKYE